MRKNATRTEGQRLLRLKCDESTQESVGKLLGRTQSAVSAWYLGHSRPDADVRCAMYSLWGWHPNVWIQKPQHVPSVKRLQNTRKRNACAGAT